MLNDQHRRHWWSEKGKELAKCLGAARRNTYKEAGSQLLVGLKMEKGVGLQGVAGVTIAVQLWVW